MGPPADIEALRCVANGLLTQMTGADLWQELGGGDDCIQWLKVRQCPFITYVRSVDGLRQSETIVPPNGLS